MTIQTPNFHPAIDKKLRCTCGHPECDQRSVDQATLDKAQLMRDDYGSPMTINSGGRCPHHPDEKDKDEPGDHQKCKTIDFECTDYAAETKIKVLAGRHGATRVAGGAYCGFVHAAWTDTERTDVPTWSY
ncbi:MAG: hypothetical protein GY942_19565 [Aestuariibacter sp.]|nr:hypothetical protein [Aestuariibacter sp.]